MPTSPPALRADWSESVVQRLRAIAQLPRRRDRVSQLASCDENTLICLVELIINILAGNVPLKDTVTRRRLYRQREQLRALSRLRSPPHVRNLLVQKGGSPLAALLPILTRTLLTLIPGLVSNVV